MKFKTNNLYFVACGFLICLLGLSGCKSSESQNLKPDCIKSNMAGLELKWGEMYNGKSSSGYMTDDAAGLYRGFWPDGSSSSGKTTKLAVIDPRKYCSMIRLVENEMINIQALYVQADTSRFVEIKVPLKNIYFRAVWNPKYQNVANKGFSAVYDSLSTLVPSE